MKTTKPCGERSRIVFLAAAVVIINCQLSIINCSAQPTLVWAKSMGGTLADNGNSIAVDGSGNIYTAGTFNGTVDFDPGAPVVNLTAAGGDIFVSKLDALGNFLWAIQMGGTALDICSSIAIDGSGNVYTTGYFQGTADFDPGGPVVNLTSAGSTDIFVSKLDASGTFVWAVRMGGTGGGSLTELGSSIAVDGSGNVYTTGNFTGTADFDPGGPVFNLTSAGGADIFVSKLDAAGNFVWAKNMGGTSSEQSNSIAVDVGGNVLTTGLFAFTADFDPGGPVVNLTSAGGNDIFVSKLNASGNFVWAKQMGGTSVTTGDRGQSIAVDGSGNVYTTGAFIGTGDFNPGGPVFNLTSAGSQDIFVSKLDASGNFVWAFSAGGTLLDYANSIALNPLGNRVYIIGDQYSNPVDYDPVGTYDVSNSGTEANFIAQYDNSGNFLCAMAITPGHNETERNRHLAVDGSGNVWVAAMFNDVLADFDPCPPFYNPGVYGGIDIYVAKYDFSACNCALLPIELLAFTANCTDHNTVRLQWQTATETNNDYFTIERSTSPDPSKGGGLNWEVAGTVKGAGNSSTVRSYKFIDNQVLPFGEDLGGVVYYRLTQTDFDGKTETFNSQQAAVDVTECAVKVFPNPAGNTLHVPYVAEQDGEVILEVFDVIGKLVKEKSVTATKGNNKFTLDLSTVAGGMYVLRVKGAAKELNQKFACLR